MRRSASRMPTRSSSSSTRLLASARFQSGLCSSADSISCLPMRMKGFSEVIGSWKMKLMRPPRRLRRVFSSASSTEVPSKSMLDPSP